MHGFKELITSPHRSHIHVMFNPSTLLYQVQSYQISKPELKEHQQQDAKKSNSHPVYTRSTSFTHSEERMKMISNSFSLGFHVKNFTYLCFLFVFCHHGTHGYFISIRSNLLMTMTNVYLLCNIHFMLYNSSSMMNS